MVASYFLTVSFLARNSSEGPYNCFFFSFAFSSSTFFFCSSSYCFCTLLISIYSTFRLLTSSFAAAICSIFLFAFASAISFAAFFLFIISSKYNCAFVYGGAMLLLGTGGSEEEGVEESRESFGRGSNWIFDWNWGFLAAAMGLSLPTAVEWPSLATRSC